LQQVGVSSIERRMTMTLYGIPNCDTVKRARRWLDEHGVAYAFHDYRKNGVDEAALRGWIGRLGWEALLNRSGTTFRKLPEDMKRDIDAEKAMAIMLANPSAIRRPVVVQGDRLVVGFDQDRFAPLAG
jgi:Spx/MgsR family transcriptional regulator